MKIIGKLFFVFIISFTHSTLTLKYFFNKRRNFSEYALGEQTVSYFAKDSLGNSIHISAIDSVGLNKLYNFSRKLPKKKTILILAIHNLIQLIKNKIVKLIILSYLVNN